MQRIEKLLVAVEKDGENRFGQYDKAFVCIDGIVDSCEEFLKLGGLFCFVPLRLYRGVGCYQRDAGIDCSGNLRYGLPGKQYQRQKEQAFAPVHQNKCCQYCGKLPLPDAKITLCKHQFGFEPVEGERMNIA